MHIKAILNGVIVSCEDGNITLTFLMVRFDTILCSLNGVKGLGALLVVFGLSLVSFQILLVYSTMFKQNKTEKNE